MVTGTWILWLFIQLGMSSSQRTFIFFRGVETTNQYQPYPFFCRSKHGFRWFSWTVFLFQFAVFPNLGFQSLDFSYQLEGLFDGYPQWFLDNDGDLTRRNQRSHGFTWGLQNMAVGQSRGSKATLLLWQGLHIPTKASLFQFLGCELKMFIWPIPNMCNWAMIFITSTYRLSCKKRVVDQWFIRSQSCQGSENMLHHRSSNRLIGDHHFPIQIAIKWINPSEYPACLCMIQPSQAPPGAVVDR